MLKNIDKMQSIMTEKVLGTEIIPNNKFDDDTYNVLFGLELTDKKQDQNINSSLSLKGIIADINFGSIEDAQEYADKIMNTDLDFNKIYKR